ncbi:MAG: hypothetical protein IT184_09795 [Acidobacteria bacterium]|nr:hypothetical protein [Acidobacteriota bacterium]
MRTLLEREILSAGSQLLLLAPPGRAIPETFTSVRTDPGRWRTMLDAVQRLRGAVYVQDGAVRQLSADGRHETDEDERCWHVVRLDEDGEPAACIRYLEHDARGPVDDLRVSTAPVFDEDAWGGHVRAALEAELAAAAAREAPYGEVGGWACAAARRCRADGVVLALSAFSLLRHFGGALAVAAATTRHGSAAMLRRLGGARLEHAGVVLPPYFDPQYGCQMELLRFDSLRPHSRYERLVRALADVLGEVDVCTPAAASAAIPAGASVAA